MQMSRRALLRGAAATAVAFGGFARLFGEPSPVRATDPGFGPLVRDPDEVMDLPRGFRYRVISRIGDEMDDGLIVPGAMDGMGAFRGPAGTTILVRNHEIKPNQLALGAFGRNNERLSKIDRSKLYDDGRGTHPNLGGTTTLVYEHATGKVLRQAMSLAGTRYNCAGGITPWGTWLSCEETVKRASDMSRREHGYVFEVEPSARPTLVEPRPLVAMGRFRHEAAAVDVRSGAVYMTEDRPDGLFYRFLPHRPGQLVRGGRLQALVVRDLPHASAAERFTVGSRRAVRWVDLADVEAPDDGLRAQGAGKGAARFSRGEGMWAGSDGIYFAATTGGKAGEGQVWRYTPSPAEGRRIERKQPGRLTLFLEPNDGSRMENCDNLTVCPWGDLLLCEDGVKPIVTRGNHLVGVTPAGRLYTFARNRYKDGRKELAGACFSPDGSTLFVNIQHPGLTLAITGPWPVLARARERD